MKKQATKPAVTPPTSYKAPSLPTLAAFGLLAAALTTGCKDNSNTIELDGFVSEPRESSAEESLYTEGQFSEPVIAGGISEPIERETAFITMGDPLPPLSPNPDTPKSPEPEVENH